MLSKFINKIRDVLLEFGRLCLIIFDWTILLLFKRKTAQIDGNILVVRLDAIGDFILWLDAAKDLRRLYPVGRYRITLLGNMQWTSLAQGLPDFDEVWSLNKRKFSTNPLYRLAMLRKVRRAAFQIVLQPAFSRYLIYGDSIVRASGSPVRIGSQGDLSNISQCQKRISDGWYTTLVAATDNSLMELERNAEFMRGVGLKEFNASIPNLAAAIAKNPPNFNLKGYYVLSPFASVDFKKWPLASFNLLAKYLYDLTGWTGIVCGGRGDEKYAEILQKETLVPMQNWVARTSLQELTGIIAHANILIGNDTSLIHIAAAVSTPAVCILGGGHFGRFLPYQTGLQSQRPVPVPVYKKMDCFGCGWKCIYTKSAEKTALCIANVSVDSVWEAVKKILDSYEARNSIKSDVSFN